MTEQDTLFGHHYRGTDPATSRQGPVNLTKSCQRILGVIRDSFGVNATFTDGDLAIRARDDRNIVARRRKDLVDLGLVEPVGVWTSEGWEPTTRMGRRGRQEEVWRLSAEGWLFDVVEVAS